jgi:hypothetical protein
MIIPDRALAGRIAWVGLNLGLTPPGYAPSPLCGFQLPNFPTSQPLNFLLS